MPTRRSIEARALREIIVEMADERVEFALADLTNDLCASVFDVWYRRLPEEPERRLFRQGVTKEVSVVLHAQTKDVDGNVGRKYIALEDGPKARWIVLSKARKYQVNAAYVLLRKKAREAMAEVRWLRAYAIERFGEDPEEYARELDRRGRDEE